METLYPSEAPRKKLEAPGLDRDLHDIESLSRVCGIRLEVFERIDPDVVARIAISALRFAELS